ncbi:MAG: glycerol-3-phosphate 1-O-acyltransferase PlsY [Bacteroidales bacterium]|jgi:glycerol-3-phosphate acyltransferase PlsY|nr:glycerol-3-phosphate 1-O-acyltransferase PlsY [Bacteroidales bacterium]
MWHNFILAITAYLLGSIPPAIWIGKALHGIDIRQYGSKNAGTSNTMRILGVKTGIPVLLIDVLKGFVAVKLAGWSSFQAGTDAFVNMQLALGVLAVLGHLFPVFAGFRGGKGVATSAGILLALYWPAALVSIGVFLLSLFISKYMSLSSLIMGISYPISIIFIFRFEFISLKIFSIGICLILIVTHWKNISRLLHGEENKATFLFRNAKNKAG